MRAYPIYELTQVESLRHLIDLRAEDNPNGTAFFYTGDDGSVKTVTYSRFRDDVAACATYFMSQGYRDGAHIALLGVNSYEWLVTFFAVCNSGNVILPMDARQPVENTMKLLVSGDCMTLVYSKEFAPAIPAFEVNIPGFKGFPMTEEEFTEVFSAAARKLLVDNVALINTIPEAWRENVIARYGSEDFGVADFLRERYPDLPLHASTQMNICSPESAKYVQSLGFTRVVPARELSLEEHRRIRETAASEPGDPVCEPSV